MGPYNKMFWFIVTIAGCLFSVLVVAILLKLAFEPDCKAHPDLMVCKWEVTR